jgi:hypothetical protein
MWPDTESLQAWYTKTVARVWDAFDHGALSAAVYTQTTDVETECNGLLTYDRSVQKIPLTILVNYNSGAFRELKYNIVMADALAEAAPVWNYTLREPPANWNTPDFVPENWMTGPAGFGSKDVPGNRTRTVWQSSDIWLTRRFTIAEGDLSKAKLRVHHDDDVEIYLNGKMALATKAWLTDYALFDIAPEALASLKPGTNSIAVHCHQINGGQYIDVGLVVPTH